MLALEDELTQQVLEVGAVEFAIELLVDGAVLDAARGGLVGVVVEPGAERVAGERDAIGVAVIALAQVELLVREHRLEAFTRDALLRPRDGTRPR